MGSGALDDKQPLLAMVNDESDCATGTCSVIMVGVVAVTADDDGTVSPLAFVVGLINR